MILMEISSWGARDWRILASVPPEQRGSLSSPYCLTHINRTGKLHEMWHRHTRLPRKREYEFLLYVNVVVFLRNLKIREVT